MKMLRAILAGLFLLLIGMGALLLLIQADANLFRQPVMALAAWQLGRPVVIDGDLAIRAGRTLYVSVAGIRLPDTGATGRPDILAVRRAAIEIDIPSLFRRPIVVERVEIEGASLIVERPGEKVETAGGDDGGFRWPESLPVVFSEIMITDSRVAVSTPQLARPVDLRLTRLTQTHATSGILRIDGEGQVNEIPLRIEGSAGPFESLLSARDFSVAARLAAGDLSIALETRIDSLAKPSGSTVSVSLRAPDTDYLRTHLGVQDLGAGPVELDGEVTPDSDGPGLRGSLKGSIGQFVLDASGELDDPGAMTRASLDIDLSGPDLRFAGALAGIDNLPSEPFRLRSSLARDNDRLLIDHAKLSVADSDFSVQGSVGKLGSMANVDVTFAFQGPDAARVRAWLGLPAQVRGGFNVSGEFRSGDHGRQSVDITAATNLVNLQISGKLGAFPDYYGTHVHITASGDNLAKLGEARGIRRLPARGFTASGDVEWTSRGVDLSAAELQTGPDRLALDGRIGKDPLGVGTDFRFEISGSSLAGLAGSIGFSGIDGLPSAPYSLQGRLRREKTASRLDDLSGTLAQARVSASGRIGDTPARDTALKFSIDGPQLREFAGLLPGYTLPDGAFSVDGNAELQEQALILRDVRLAAAGAEAAADARLALPLPTSTGRFDIQARGPELSRFLAQIGKTAMPRGAFDVAVRGTVADGRWTFEQARLNTGLGRASGTGTLDFAPDFSATTLRLDVQADSLADIGRLADISLPQQPFRISAEFSGTPTALVARNASGRLGEADFSGQLSVDLADRPTVDLQLKTSMLDSHLYMGDKVKPGKATAARGAVRSARVIPNMSLSLDWLRKFDGSLALEADSARMGNLALGNTSLRSTLRNGDLRVEAFEAQALPDGRLTVSGSLMQRDGIASLQLTASGTHVSLSLPNETPEQHKARPRGDIELELAGQGTTLRELAATLDGHLTLMSGPGEVPGVDTGRYFGSLWRQLAGLVSPGLKELPTTKVACLAAFVRARDGVLETVPALVLQTDRINMIARGTVRLASEEINALLRITTRDRLDINIAEIVNPNIRLVGTLASPAPRVDSKSTILTGGAAVATGGLSIVALNVWDRVFKADDPCAEMAKEAKALESGESPKRRSLLPKLLRRR